MELNASAADILERSRRIDLYRAVGQPIADPSVQTVGDWRAALKKLASIASENYFLDAHNYVSGQSFLHNQAEFNTWNKVIHEANKVLVPEVLPRIEAGLPVEGRKRKVLGNVVLNMFRDAVVERQLRVWHDSDFYLRVFEWLERGHLPCGGTEEFPKGKLVVF